MEGVEARWHEHTSSEELFFVLSGQLEVDVRLAPDTSIQTFRIGPGELLKVHAGQQHRARASDRTTLLVIDGL